MCFIPKGRKKYVTPYTDPVTGKKRKKTWTTDKAQSERMEARFLHELFLRKQGLVDPTAERFAQAERTPLATHVGDYIKRLEAKDCDPRHIRTTRTYVERVISQGRVLSLSGLTAAVVEDALVTITERGRRGKSFHAATFNAHLAAIKAFARWAWLHGRARTFELGSIQRRNAEANRAYVRRVLSDDELRALIWTACTGPTWRKISGNDRSWFYIIASATGYRRSEIAELRHTDFHFDERVPFIGLSGEFTKNGRDAAQPIPAKLAEALRPWLASKATDAPLFSLPEKTAQMMRYDLTRCGIPAVDLQGRVVDTHSLRHGYITALGRAGVPESVRTLLARHSDPRLTLKVYTHLEAFDLFGAAQTFANLVAEPSAAILSPTGTDGPCATQLTTHVDVDGFNSLPSNTLPQEGSSLLISGL